MEYNTINIKPKMFRKKSIRTFATQEYGNRVIVFFKGISKEKHFSFDPMLMKLKKSGSIHVDYGGYTSRYIFHDFGKLNRSVIKLLKSGQKENIILGVAFLNQYLKQP